VPANQVMKEYAKGTLHSGSKSGPIVKNPRQAKAILLSELRDEGHDIPEKPKRKSGRSHGRSSRR